MNSVKIRSLQILDKLRNLKYFYSVKILQAFLSTILLNTLFFGPLLADLKNKNPTNLNKQIQSNYKDTYLLGPGDKLLFKIFDTSELDNELTIINDGTVQIPYVGTVELSGLTINEAIYRLKTNLEELLINPQIQLQIINQRPAKVSVIGEVTTPGVYSLNMNYASKENNNTTSRSINYPTVINAIQEAGGITSNANLQKVVLIRKNKGDDSFYKKTNLNFLKLIKEGDQIQNPFIFDGDVIKVLKSESADNNSFAKANFSPKSLNIYVVGEVKNPGKLEINPNTPLTQAILAAGGPSNWRANKGKIKLIRINENGTITSKRFKLDFGKGISQQNNPLLREGDTIYVQRNPLAVGGDIVESIAKPASNIVNIYSLLKIINDD